MRWRIRHLVMVKGEEKLGTGPAEGGLSPSAGELGI